MLTVSAVKELNRSKFRKKRAPEEQKTDAWWDENINRKSFWYNAYLLKNISTGYLCFFTTLYCKIIDPNDNWSCFLPGRYRSFNGIQHFVNNAMLILKYCWINLWQRDRIWHIENIFLAQIYLSCTFHSEFFFFFLYKFCTLLVVNFNVKQKWATN